MLKLFKSVIRSMQETHLEVRTFTEIMHVELKLIYINFGAWNSLSQHTTHNLHVQNIKCHS